MTFIQRGLDPLSLESSSESQNENRVKVKAKNIFPRIVLTIFLFQKKSVNEESVDFIFQNINSVDDKEKRLKEFDSFN